MYHKWPDKIFPMVNFIFSHDGHFGRGGGGILLLLSAVLIHPSVGAAGDRRGTAKTLSHPHNKELKLAQHTNQCNVSIVKVENQVF